MSKYDAIVVGAGPAGIFACYELTRKAPHWKVLLVDKGHDIYRRRCPILEEKITLCPPPAGKRVRRLPAGLFDYGRVWRSGSVQRRKVQHYDRIRRLAERLYRSFPSAGFDQIRRCGQFEHGATTNITDPLTEAVRGIEQRGYAAGLKLLRAQVRHLGTEQNLEILKSIYEYLNTRIDMMFKAEVEDLITVKSDGGHQVCGIQLKSGETHEADLVMVAPGRDGSAWLTDILKKRRLKMTNNQVDVGVRVETSDVVMLEINEHLYEGKFIYNTSVGTRVRTFCSNPSGHVVVENHSGVMAANGHSFKDPALGSQNTNFALLVSHKFTEPFDKPNEYAREICQRANDLSNGGVIVQKYGDILRGRRSTAGRIAEGFLEPTLKEAVPGDLGLVLPYNTMKSLIEMVEALDKVTPGIASEHTLFYGVEAKFYSARPKLTESLETEIGGLFCGGDGAGITRGLAQAGAAGVWIARGMLKKAGV